MSNTACGGGAFSGSGEEKAKFEELYTVGHQKHRTGRTKTRSTHVRRTMYIQRRASDPANSTSQPQLQRGVFTHSNASYAGGCYAILNNERRGVDTEYYHGDRNLSVDWRA